MQVRFYQFPGGEAAVPAMKRCGPHTGRQTGRTRPLWTAHLLSVIGTSVWCGSFVGEGLCWPCQKKTPEKGKGRKPSSKAAAAAAGGPGKKVEAVLVTKQNFFLKTVRQGSRAFSLS